MTQVSTELERWAATRPDMVKIEHVSVHQLRAKIKDWTRSGVAVRCWPVAVDRRGVASVWMQVDVRKYRRVMRPAIVRRGPRIVALVVGVLAVLGLAGWLLWESRYVIGAVLLVAGAVALLVNRARHSGVCTGLHCAGCKG